MAYNISNELGLDTVLGGDSLTGTDEYEMLLDAARALQNAYTQDRQSRNDAVAMDMDTLGRIERVATGAEPSLAEQLARKAVEQSGRQSVGLAATLGGANPGAALRAGYEAQQDAPSQSAAELEALRAREMDAARALFAQQTGRAHATDVAQAQGTGNTYATIAGAPFGALSSEAAASAAREAAILQAGATGISAYQKNNQPGGPPNQYTTYDPFATPSDISGKTDVQPSPGMADDFLRGLTGGAISQSEVDAVSNATAAPVTARGLTGDPIRRETGAAISPAEADAFLSTLRPQSFKYKNPDGVNKQPGTRMGVMAQDLPDHDVVTDPTGRKWISADVISDVLAGMGRLNEKIDARAGASGRGGRATSRPAPQSPQEPQQPTEVMIPQSAVHDYLAGLGIVPP